MKAFFGLVAALITSAAAAAGPLEDQVTRAYADWDAAFNKADGKAVAAFYVRDSIFLPANHEIIKGPGGVETFFTGLFGAGVAGHKLDLIDAKGDGNTVVAAAKWSAKAGDKAIGGIATHVFEKQSDGNLKLRLHTFN